MRQRKSKGGLIVNAVAGTHVVMLGLDLERNRRAGCLGFAVQREDLTEDERYWMSGTKTFNETDPGLGPGGQVSSRLHPFQTFQWADYSAKPGHDYVYTVIPLSGSPSNLKPGGDLSVRISTEPEYGPSHSVFFNRGSIASQEYARRFQNQDPDKVGPAAFAWLSRGLLEAFKTFVARANGRDYGLRGAIYEFQLPQALQAIKSAAAAGADIKIIYDAITGGTGPCNKNKSAIGSQKIGALCQPRTKGKIMHNKFLVLLKKNKPIAVWTGSTNLTENGVFGHSNLGHIVEDRDLAGLYLDYWNELKDDPEASFERGWITQNNPQPAISGTESNSPVFSPHRGLGILGWYTQVAGSAQKALFMTFAFGMNKEFQAVYDKNDKILRFALMEKEGNGKGLAAAKKAIRAIRARPNVIVAVGNHIPLNSFDRWLKERGKLTKGANIKWIHTKYMLVDPLGNKPIVITGSANFSEASTNVNDENMVVIENNTRVADIYIGEFMRLYSHYAFREAVAIAKEKKEKDWQPNFLIPDDSWQKDYFNPKHQRFLRRVYFAGS
jgi:hypothetical protein